MRVLQALDHARSSPAGARSVLPIIVALWFAVLLGFGMLVLPAAPVERIALASGIASLVPMANPPFGMTERALIALAAAGIGGVAGLALARLVTTARNGTSLASCPDMPVPRPLNAHEELGGFLDWTTPELPEVQAEPVNPSLRGVGLIELVEQLRIVVEQRQAPLIAPIHAVNGGMPTADIDSALRASLARLRRLRGAV